MSITKEKVMDNGKELLSTVEEKIEKGVEVVKETLGNVARHLPLANFAKHSTDTYDIEIDLPGVDKSEIELKIEDDYIVQALRRTKKEINEEDYYLLESSYGLISRSFVLPKDADREKISANYEDGRLYITLEKEEAKKARSISIK